MARRRRNRKGRRRPSRSRSRTPSRAVGQHRTAGSDPWERLRQIVEDHRRLVAAVEAHKAELRAACGHLRQEGATLSQIAAVLGISPQAVHKYWLPPSQE